MIATDLLVVVSHSTWGLGFQIDHMLFATLGASIVVYRIAGPNLNGHWMDSTQRICREVRGAPYILAADIQALNPGSNAVNRR